MDAIAQIQWTELDPETIAELIIRAASELSPDEVRDVIGRLEETL